MCRRICSLLLSLMLLCALALPVCAHEVPDAGRTGSISITMTHQDEPVPGGTITLYRVADVVSDDGDYLFAYTADFAGCTLPLTNLDTDELPRELAKIAGEKKLRGTTRTLDDNGRVKFENLEIGLYLLVQEKAAPGFRKVNPFLVSVPQNDDGRYIYDVDTAPKNLPGPEEEPTTPTQPTQPTEPGEPELPQTGQLNWPVPLMAVLGMLLVVTGVVLCSSDRRNRHN